LSDPAPFVLAHEPLIRLGAFAAVFAALAGWEALAPRRPRAISRTRRWPNNLGLAALNTVVVRFVFPTAAVGAAIIAEERGWGLLHAADLPRWLQFIAAIVLLDLLLYAQHVMFHAVPPLWRLHRVHHADLDVDVTTGARFHPIEIVLSMAIKIAAVAALGAPAAAVVVFEVLLNALSMFNHANARIPARLDRLLRLAIVTPDMHRVHHSVHPRETNSNFGFQASWWDRLFRTYRAQPEDGHEMMTLGLPILREPAQLRLDRMLMQPFRRE
jgi:sterol desaturase/sphingolipid hydroxylase (fatty acid hydroxylase superfamily)